MPQAQTAIAEPTSLEALTRSWEPSVFPRGHVLFSQGEPGDELHVLQSGAVKLNRKFRDGRENILAIMGPSDMLGELSVCDPGPQTATATAVTEVRAWVIDNLTLRRWMQNHRQIAEELLRVIARQQRRTHGMLADLIFTDVPGRVAKTLLQLAHRFGSHHGGYLRVTHNLTQLELAQYVGASRETVNKTLADFVQRGWLRLEDKSTLILEPERLARRVR